MDVEAHPTPLPQRVAWAVSDPLTVGLVALLVVAWCIEGILDFTGLPHRTDVLIDLSEVSLCVSLAARLIRDRAFPRVPVLVFAYLLWVLAGLVTHAPAGAVVTALRNLLLLPALALLVAAQGTTERRARVVVATLLGLGALEFAITVEQAVRFGSNTDAIVGSFGASANAVTAAVVLLAVCVAVGGYLVRAPGGTVGLAIAATLPLFSAWAAVKIVPVLLPFVVIAVAVPAWLLRQTSWRRAVASVAAATLSAGLVVTSYAAFKPDSFSLLLKSSARTNYLRNASIYRTTPIPSALHPGSHRPRTRGLGNIIENPDAEVDAAGMVSYANAVISRSTVAHSGRASFRMGNAVSGDYTAQVTNYDGTRIAIRRNTPYVFSAYVAAGAKSSQTIAAQIEWRDSGDRIVGTTLGTPISLAIGVSGYRRIVAAGRAPRRALTATPKIAVTRRPATGSAIYADALQLERGTLPKAYVPVPRRAIHPEPSLGRPVPGRLTQWHMAEREISGSVATKMFGRGLGSATVAENVGVHPQDLSAEAEAASYSDFGTLLVERGWTGIAVVALFAAALAWASFRIALTVPRGQWTTAFTLAVPGALCVMASYGMIADQLRSAPAALTFWLVVAFGLSPRAFLAGRPWRSRNEL